MRKIWLLLIAACLIYLAYWDRQALINSRDRDKSWAIEVANPTLCGKVNLEVERQLDNSISHPPATPLGFRSP